MAIEKTATRIRLGDVLNRSHKVIVYGSDEYGDYAEVEFGSELVESLIVKRIDLAASADECVITESFVPAAPSLDMWSDDEKREQESQAFAIVREIEAREETFKRIGAEHRARITSLKLQLRALAHGAFPAEEGDLSLFPEANGNPDQNAARSPAIAPKLTTTKEYKASGAKKGVRVQSINGGAAIGNGIDPEIADAIKGETKRGAKKDMTI